MDNPDPTQFISITDHVMALRHQQAEFDATIAAERQIQEDTLISKDEELASLQPLRSLYEEMVPKVSAALASGDPELFLSLGREFLTPEKEKRRAQLEAELALLD